MKTTASREVMIEKTSMETGVDIIRGVVGDMMTEERIRKFILGANGDVQIALNHALNFFEKKTGEIKIYFAQSELIILQETPPQPFKNSWRVSQRR